ncbi:MAG: MarR family transcriptional regulator [Acidobacteria bacterium]|nr:MAG: MarR family transcriptional regulator [Acidobacteriota bacterium]
MLEKLRQVESQQNLELADRLHSAAIHLLRRLRREDSASGLSAPRLSALSVIIFGGPVTMGELAAAEQVRPPTISRLVKDLERQGLVSRKPDPGDERVQRVSATAKGKRLLNEGRRRRVSKLATGLARLSSKERRQLLHSAELLERLTLPDGHPDSRKTGRKEQQQRHRATEG